MQSRVRTLMIAVAIAGAALGLVVHVRVVVRQEDDFALGMLILEGMAVAVLLAIASAVGLVIHLVRKDATYAARLRRNEVPSQCPRTCAETDSPVQE